MARMSGFPVATWIHEREDLEGPRAALGRIAPWLVFDPCSRAVARAWPGRSRWVAAAGRCWSTTASLSGKRARPEPAADTLVVGTIGVVEPRKGTDLFVDMAAVSARIQCCLSTCGSPAT